MAPMEEHGGVQVTTLTRVHGGEVEPLMVHMEADPPGQRTTPTLADVPRRDRAPLLIRSGVVRLPPVGDKPRIHSTSRTRAEQSVPYSHRQALASQAPRAPAEVP